MADERGAGPLAVRAGRAFRRGHPVPADGLPASVGLLPGQAQLVADEWPRRLYLDGVSVVFDGFRALNEPALVVEPGELRAIIGPNGAGKTTMMDVITGKTRPTGARRAFGEASTCTRMDEAGIANLGIGRKFQKPTVFDALTVFENLELALKAPRGPVACLRWALSGEAEAASTNAAGDRPCRTGTRRGRLLSHGQRQWLEIGMLLDAGAGADAGGRAGSRHDGCRDRAHRRAARTHRRPPQRSSGGARHGIRPRAEAAG